MTGWKGPATEPEPTYVCSNASHRTGDASLSLIALPHMCCSQVCRQLWPHKTCTSRLALVPYDGLSGQLACCTSLRVWDECCNCLCLVYIQYTICAVYVFMRWYNCKLSYMSFSFHLSDLWCPAAYMINSTVYTRHFILLSAKCSLSIEHLLSGHPSLHPPLGRNGAQ